MSAPELRFRVGSRVQCNLGRPGWASGTVVALHYHEEDWPEGKTVPYQVQLDKKYDSALIYAPADLSNLIRADTDPLPGTPSLPKQQVDPERAYQLLVSEISAVKNLPFIEEVAGPRVFEVAEHEGALFTPTAMTGPWLIVLRLQGPADTDYAGSYRMHLKCNSAWPNSPAEVRFCRNVAHVCVEPDGTLDEDVLEAAEEDIVEAERSGDSNGKAKRSLCITLKAVLKLLADPTPYIPQSAPATELVKRASEESGRRLNLINTYRCARKHPRLFDVQQGWAREWFAPELMAALDAYEKTEAVDAIKALVREEAKEVYSFPLFTAEFCEMYIEEMDSFNASKLPVRRPNSMNNYGVVVNEIGLEPMNDLLQEKVLSPLSRALFPGIGSHLGHQHTFIVRYKVGEDLGLDMHTDDSDVTFNVCLGREFKGAGLQFCGNQAESNHRKASLTYHHVKGRCVVHLGHRRHGADDITEGERLNLIIWNHNAEYRSSSLYGRHNMQTPKTYEKEKLPPDPVCVSFTHDRDYGVFKAYTIKNKKHKGQGWCPPRHAEYPGFVSETEEDAALDEE